jgi:alkylation response protein AidB-like acyl-CoA dehydrogenase
MNSSPAYVYPCVTDPTATASRLAPPSDPARLPEVLRPLIESSLREGELRLDTPAPLQTALRDSGALRMLTPREYGGSETPLTTALTVYEGIGRIDASVGLLVWNANFGFIAAMLSEHGAGRLWDQTPEPFFANSGMVGTAEIVDEGVRLSGRFRIVTGVNAADWLVVGAVLTRDGSPVLVDGGPDVRLCAVRADDFTVERTWIVNAMRSTGSDDVAIDDAFVPSDFVTAALTSPPRIDRPLYRGFIPTLVFPGATAVALGVARSAVDEMVALSARKTTRSGLLLADEEHTQYAIAKAGTALKASRLLLFSAVEALQDAAQRGDEVTIELRADLRAAMTHAADVSREALVAMYELASSSALYRSDPMERKFRDGMAVLQHANHSRGFLAAAGRVRLGRDAGMALF